MSLHHVDITRELVAAVRDSVDVVDIASGHTRLKKAGKRWEGLCPLHKEKTPSFSVDPVQGLFYCFGCGAGGDAIKLHMLLAGEDFPEAIESLAKRYGIPLPERRRRGPGAERSERVEAALETAQELFVAELARSPAARSYLERRRIPPELAERFGLGYAPDGWDWLVDRLAPKTPEAILVDAGLLGRAEGSGKLYGRFRHRLMFPIHSPTGRLVGFGGRTLGDDRAKYVNSSETARFKKSRLLYGVHLARRAIRESGRALLVEGYFDVLGAVAAGIEGTVASMGTSLTAEQAALLGRYAEEVVVGYDGDEAGENAHRRALPTLLARQLGVYRARFGAGHDPDSLRLEEGPEAVVAAVREAPDALVEELDRLASGESLREPRRRAAAAGAFAELLEPLTDPVVRLSYARLAAQRFDLPLMAFAPGRKGRPGGSPAGRAAAPPPGDAPEGPAAPRGPRLVRSLEESALELLLRPGEASEARVPGVEELPPPEVFLDPGMRNIYSVYRDLYGRSGTPPTSRDVLDRLGEDAAAVDAVAAILVGGDEEAPEGGLGRLLETLSRRWQQRRLEELRREMNEAERSGDRARLEQLLEEKTRLSRSLHRPGAGGAARV